MFLFIYIISFVVVAFTVAGIVINNVTRKDYYATADAKRDSFALVFLTICPIVNTITALVIIATTSWLLIFKPGSKPNPPA